MLSFAELKFKWFFHVVGSVNQVQYMLSLLDFLIDCFTFEVNE